MPTSVMKAARQDAGHRWELQRGHGGKQQGIGRGDHEHRRQVEAAWRGVDFRSRGPDAVGQQLLDDGPRHLVAESDALF